MANRVDTFGEPMPLVHKAGTWFIVTAIAFNGAAPAINDKSDP